MTHFDALIVGQGIAGTAAAWRSRWAGRRVLVIDRGGPSASRVAAGLITPVTGQRLAVSWRLADLLPVAVEFYRRVETATGGRFLHLTGAVRLFADERERAGYESRSATLLREWVGPADPPPGPAAFAAPHGAFEMPAAARLDVTAYLDASRQVFAADGGFLDADMDPAELEPRPHGVRLPRLGIMAGAVAFCQGFVPTGNPWFPDLRLLPTHGEILTVRIPGLAERRAVHRGKWLAHWRGDLFRAGATYDHSHAEPTPTALGRAEVEAGLRDFLKLPFVVTDHRAGVRPVAPGHRPVFLVSPRDPRVMCLNGFGSKGVLQAPHYADVVAKLMG